MSSLSNNNSSEELPRLDKTGRIMRRRAETPGAADPYDSSRSFAEPEKQMEVFRRRREDRDPSLPKEREKRVKFEIVEDVSDGQPDAGGGYNPYGHSK